jgi:hypothetical protein
MNRFSPNMRIPFYTMLASFTMSYILFSHFGKPDYYLCLLSALTGRPSYVVGKFNFDFMIFFFQISKLHTNAMSLEP